MSGFLSKIYRQIAPWHNKVAYALIGLVVMVIFRRDDLGRGNLESFAETSGWIFLIAGFWWARNLDSRFESMVRRLGKRKAVDLDGSKLEAAQKAIDRRADALQLIGSILLPIFWVIGSLWFRSDSSESEPASPMELFQADLTFTPKIILESLAAVFVGGYAGRLIAYGFLGQWLKKHEATIRLHSGHPDGAGGLKVIGDFYLYQAGLVMLAVVFFGFWWVMASFWPNAGEVAWRDGFAVAFLAFLAIECLVFMLPMLFFNREMVREKESFNRKIDELGCKLVKLNDLTFEKDNPDELKSIQASREHLVERIKSLEAVPEWPVDLGIRRRFAWGNLAVVLLPVFAHVVPEFTGKIAEAIVSLIKGPG